MLVAKRSKTVKMDGLRLGREGERSTQQGPRKNEHGSVATTAYSHICPKRESEAPGRLHELTGRMPGNIAMPRSAGAMKGRIQSREIYRNT